MRSLRMGLLLALIAAPSPPRAVAQYPSTGDDGVGSVSAWPPRPAWTAPPQLPDPPRPSAREYAAPWYPAPAERFSAGDPPHAPYRSYAVYEPAVPAPSPQPQPAPRQNERIARSPGGLPVGDFIFRSGDPPPPGPTNGGPGLASAPDSVHSITFQPPPTEAATAPTGPIGQAPDRPLNEQFLTQSSLLLKPGDWQYDIGVQYAFQENTLPLFVPPDLVVDRRYRRRDLVVPLALRYGLSDKLELFCALPVGGSHIEISDALGGATAEGFGIGDTTAGLIFSLSERGKWPVITGRVEVVGPTGDPPFLPIADDPGMGNGVWAAGVGLNFVQVFDPVVVFGSVGYRHMFEDKVLGLDVQLGETFAYSLGTAFAVNDDVSLSAEFFGQVVGPTKINDIHLFNSSQEPYSIRLSLIRRLSRTARLQPFVAFGLNDDATDVSCGVIYTGDQKGGEGLALPRFTRPKF